MNGEINTETQTVGLMMRVSTIMAGDRTVSVYIPNDTQGGELHRYLVGYQQSNNKAMEYEEVCTYTYEHAKKHVNRSYKTPVVKSITYMNKEK